MTKRKSSVKESPGLQALAALRRTSAKISIEVYSPLSPQLTTSQFGILEAIYKNGPLHQVDLARQILKTPGNMTIVIDNLEKLGLVERARGKRDRRFIQIVLTPQGSRLIKQLYPAHIQQTDKIMGRLTDEERDELVRLCLKLEGEKNK
jgi:MarR family 2-MHQ and catechol resistance regulon transcriptional repressor